MLKKYFVFLFLFITIIVSAKEKTIACFIEKYNLPENLNVLSVFGEDCVNCYYGFSHFLKTHEHDFKKENFVFLFQKSAQNEIDNIFKYRLDLDKAGCKIIVDDEFYASVNSNGVTTLSIIEKTVIKEQFTSKDIHKFNNFAGTETKTQLFNLVEKDTINLKSVFGTKKLSIAAINESKIIVQNKYTNDLTLFDVKNKVVKKTLPLSSFTNIYDSILPLLLQNNDENLKYNLANYKSNDFYKTFPLCSIKKVCSVNNVIYVGLLVSRMVPDSAHINYESMLAIVKLDTNLNIQHIYGVPENIANSDRKISLSDFSFLNTDTAVVSLSVGGDRKKDTICALYSLSTNNVNLLNLSYEPYMALKGSNGYYNYYHFDVWNENSILKGHFNRSPYIYNLSDNTKSLIPDVGVDLKTIDLTGKDKFFWISKIFQYQNSAFVIANQKQNETSFLQYDIDVKTFISKKKIFDGYLSDVYILQNKIFAFENYSEKGDVAMLHIYQLK